MSTTRPVPARWLKRGLLALQQPRSVPEALGLAALRMSQSLSMDMAGLPTR